MTSNAPLSPPSAHSPDSQNSREKFPAPSLSLGETVLQAVRMVVGWTLTLTFWTVLIVLNYVSLNGILGRKRDRLHRITRWWGSSALRVLGMPIRSEVRAPLDTTEARVVVCNHQSALDLIWGATICPPRPLVIGKKEVLFIPIINLIFFAFHFIRIDRSNSEKAIASLRGVAEEIRTHRRSLVLAPEGTRTRNGSLLPFKKGAFHIAIEAQCPIVPVVVDGAFQSMPKGKFIPRPGKLKLIVLEPISTQGMDLSQVTVLRDRVHTAMLEALQKLRAET